MTLRDFLNASYALLVETWTTVQAGRLTLLEAIEKVEDGWPRAEGAPAPTKKDVASQNEAAMAQLKMMLSGVKGAPSV